MARVLIVGGIRSGKSRHAEGLLAGEPAVTYVATGGDDPTDDEWTARVAAHRARRPGHWTTVETLDVAPMLRTTRAGDAPLLLDCVNAWLAGAMREAGCWTDPPDDSAPKRLAYAVDDLVDAWSQSTARAVAVTNEVGLSLVPLTRAGRWFAEELGVLNARLAAAADEVWQVSVGIPHRLR
ncbi:MAG: bifunctional adenosylcobinamide kinase/adenosylcobinamide-phosphate guanylyltransferase [Actinobacteria bacterium]|nr:bifunctional adenosylcobinamide kinase/adenosylcobinamide-phosphate guanylyltransferase [Actinomycetota bacterium]